MNSRNNWKRWAQLGVVLLSALMLKLSYSTAGANQLRWILGPTTFLVEIVSGTSFEFESHAGYMSGDRKFIIAATCAGVNFLITAFLMLSLSKLWKVRSQNPTYKLHWNFVPLAALLAYLATLVANTLRITTALRLRGTPLEMSWLSPDQLHRLEGTFIYFGFLLLLFIVSEKMSSKFASGNQGQAIYPLDYPNVAVESRTPPRAAGLLRQLSFPLLVYYATTLGIPVANGAYRQGSDFWEHSLFVLLTPLLLILPIAAFRFLRYQRTGVRAN